LEPVLRSIKPLASFIPFVIGDLSLYCLRWAASLMRYCRPVKATNGVNRPERLELHPLQGHVKSRAKRIGFDLVGAVYDVYDRAHFVEASNYP
jgi:hypothetical protein